MRRIAVVCFGFLCMLGAWPASLSVNAQEIPTWLTERRSEGDIRERKNAWTIGIVGGLLSGTNMIFADQLAKALDDDDNIRILPIVSHGAASNLDDLLYLRGVDVAVTQADVFEYFRNARKVPNLENRVRYVLRLPISEVHILAPRSIRTIEDLRGKKVSFGPQGAGSTLTGTIIFQRLGIPVEQLFFDSLHGLQKLRAGEISATVRVIGKPINYFSKLPDDANLHLLAIPFSKKFADYYTISEFTSEEYPALVPPGQKIDTLAVPSVLAVYNWKEGTDRYRRVERFVERLFANWSKLQRPPYHPKWRDINLAAEVPGWKRFSVSERLIAESGNGSADLARDFQTYLDQIPNSVSPRDKTEREILFREFMQWRAGRRTQQ